MMESLTTSGGKEHSIVNDVYNIFFLSKIGSQGFFFTIYIFALKMVLYTLLIIDALQRFVDMDKIPIDVRVAQFLMLPICVAMQDNLMWTIFTIAKMKYSSSIRSTSDAATKMKYTITNFLRGIDGLYSLAVMFVVILIAEDVLSLFFHFSAFAFVQNISNLALKMAERGHLTNGLDAVATDVRNTSLPISDSRKSSLLGTALFLGCIVALGVLWVIIVAVLPPN